MSISNEQLPEILSSDPPAVPSDVLDPVQMRRIEAVHRGFLYQHLFAVGCLLKLRDAGAHSLSVERDEDVEIAMPDRSLYYQIKTRAAVLNRGDVTGALRRFGEIRDAHNSGTREGIGEFRIIANVPPSAVLLSDLESDDWPADVQIRWSGGPRGHEDDPLPPPWSDLPEAVAWCSEAARDIPFAAVAPGTLVWKLAALVLLAATGDDSERPAHTFHATDLPSIFEQIVEQLQEFPAVPDDYRSQADEPSLDSQNRIRIVAGLSAAGKTAWAAQAAQHCPALTAYFDVVGIPSPAIASSLARELAARFLGRSGGTARAAILSFSSGLDMLRALDRYLGLALAPIVVIDNAHNVAPRDLFDIACACSRVRFVLLAQPWAGLAELEALFGESTEWLSGWDGDTVATEFVNAGCRINPATAERWRAATAGMPLFVKNAAYLTASLWEGDAARFADEVETEEHSVPTVQEIILGRVTAALGDDSRMALAILSLSTAPLFRDEARRILGALPPPAAPWGRSLRELASRGALQVFANGRLKVHDAVRVLGRNMQADLPPGLLLVSQTLLRDLLFHSLSEKFDLVRFGAWLRLLTVTGAFDTLIDIATMEIFHEFGDPVDLRGVLEAAVSTNELDDVGRFWTLDALAFWDWQSGERGQAFLARVDQMGALVEKGTLGHREQLAFAMKRMLRAAMISDLDWIETAFEEAVREIQADSEQMRLLRYNYAVSLFHLGHIEDAETVAESLFLEYYEVLGLELDDVLGVNPSDIMMTLGGELSDHQDNLKHLADCLSLYAMSRRNRGLEPGLADMHAFKFYVMARAYRSAVKVGQEVVDGFIRILLDPEEARQFMESHLIPLIRETGLIANLVPVRAQYAVVLAYCGEREKARKEMESLQSYAASLPPGSRHELQRQAELIEAITSGLITMSDPAREVPLVPKRNTPVKVAKVGRNEPCPCGSGKKYKKCCLRND